MKSIALLLAYTLILLNLNAPAMALQVSGKSVQLTDAEVRACQDGGGCHVITVMQLDAALDEAQHSAGRAGFEAGLKKGYAIGFEAGRKAQKASV